MPTAAPAPAARIPLGEVSALETGLVKNLSRKLAVAIADRQKFEITEVNTLVIVSGSLAL